MGRPMTRFLAFLMNSIGTARLQHERFTFRQVAGAPGGDLPTALTLTTIAILYDAARRGQIVTGTASSTGDFRSGTPARYSPQKVILAPNCNSRGVLEMPFAKPAEPLPIVDPGLPIIIAL